jgi:transcriptional regulator with XRE-family HTH domain
MAEDEGARFWERIESLREISWKELADKASADFSVMVAQKSMNRLPKITDICRYAETLGTSVEWLISGRQSETAFSKHLYDSLDERQKQIIDKLLHSDAQVLNKIEKILAEEPTQQAK